MLEDCYDPFVVLEQLERVSKEGYIETPRAWIETTKWLVYKSRHIKGYAHHVWMVDVLPVELLDDVFTINPIVTKPGEKYPRDSKHVLCFYPKVILSHHELLHHNFIGTLKAWRLRKKYGTKLEALSLHWKDKIPYTCIWWGSHHFEALEFWTRYHKEFDYDNLPDCYQLPN